MPAVTLLIIIICTAFTVTSVQGTSLSLSLSLLTALTSLFVFSELWFNIEWSLSSVGEQRKFHKGYPRMCCNYMFGLDCFVFNTGFELYFWGVIIKNKSTKYPPFVTFLFSVRSTWLHVAKARDLQSMAKNGASSFSFLRHMTSFLFRLVSFCLGLSCTFQNC